MATLILTPFPNAGTAGRTAAITYIKSQVAGRVAESDTALVELSEVASAMVEREAPGAPQSIRNEAALRFIAYLSTAESGTVRSETTGPLTTDYVVMHGPAFRRCGSKALLSPWKIRRAGAI